jgi:protein gp37
MSDLFHPKVPDEFIVDVFHTMTLADWHIFQILTKRPQRMARLAADLPWPPHVWMGVSVESNEYTWRADYLRKTPANVRFISEEPLLGPVDRLDLEGIHWVITGGESGPRPSSLRS